MKVEARKTLSRLLAVFMLTSSAPYCFASETAPNRPLASFKTEEILRELEIRKREKERETERKREREREKIATRLTGFDPAKARILVFLRKHHLPSNPCLTNLLAVAKIIKSICPGLLLDRDSVRRKNVLLKWFDENWDQIEPILSNALEPKQAVTQTPMLPIMGPNSADPAEEQTPKAARYDLDISPSLTWEESYSSHSDNDFAGL